MQNVLEMSNILYTDNAIKLLPLPCYIALLGHYRMGHAAGINLALCAVSLAEAAGDHMPVGKLAEIYATAALTVKMSFPLVLQGMTRYFLRSARKVCIVAGADVPCSLKWLCHPLGHRFFVDGNWAIEGKVSIFSSRGNDADPLAHVTLGFREHLLENTLYSLVTPGYENDSIIGPNRGSDG